MTSIKPMYMNILYMHIESMKMVQQVLPKLTSQRFDFFFFLGSSSLSSASRFLSSLQQVRCFKAACDHTSYMASMIALLE